MKETLKPIFLIIIATLCLLFSLFLFSHVESLSAILLAHNKNNISSLSPNDSDITHTLSLNLKYYGGTLSIGEEVTFSSLFNLETSPNFSLSNPSNIQFHLLDIRNTSGQSALSFLNSEEIEALEEIPSSAVYDKTNDLLIFFQSGIYTVHLRLYYDNKPGNLYEFTLPVESRTL